VRHQPLGVHFAGIRTVSIDGSIVTIQQWSKTVGIVDVAWCIVRPFYQSVFINIDAGLKPIRTFALTVRACRHIPFRFRILCGFAVLILIWTTLLGLNHTRIHNAYATRFNVKPLVAQLSVDFTE
jgi:hypothetical protein